MQPSRVADSHLVIGSSIGHRPEEIQPLEPFPREALFGAAPTLALGEPRTGYTIKVGDAEIDVTATDARHASPSGPRRGVS